jgi:hypothetical protein
MAKIILRLILALVWFSITPLFARQTNQTSTWVGWITDNKCGAKSAHADHKDCAIRCVTKQGQSWVFVPYDGVVMGIQNQKAVYRSAIGHEVKVTGRIAEDGLLYIEGIQDYAQPK